MADRRHDTRRVNDNQVKWITEQFKELKAEFKYIQELFARKFDNGVNKKFEDILLILNKLPCDVQTLEINTLKNDFEDKIKTSVNNKHWVTGIIVGLICGLPSFIMVALKIIELVRK